MKNIILGMIGGAVAIYLVVFCLSVYSISARKNEMENCISQVLEQNMIHFYGNTDNDVEVKQAVTQDLITRLQADSKIVVDVYLRYEKRDYCCYNPGRILSADRNEKEYCMHENSNCRGRNCRDRNVKA